MADFSYSDDQELKQLNQNVLNDPEEFEHWDKLVRAAESQESGLNRNSNPAAITATRQVYDRFLARFPLFFGYWKKYADLEFNIAGTEAADMVYERGVASIGVSVDLWTHYCTFKLDTCHDPDLIRELFERAAESIGLDYMSHPFWDKYIEFEERSENPAGVFKIYSRLLHIPIHQYARYFEKFTRLAALRPVDELAPLETVASLKQAVQSDGHPSGPDAEAELRSKLLAYHNESFQNLGRQVNERWEYESEIKRPYYHVTELDDTQIANWNKYLDFEEKQGNYERTKFLYERCMVTAANYDDLWFRYVRWMLAHGGKTEEVRNIYQRACCLYVPISQPRIRLLYAAFEESIDQPSKAADVHEAILLHLPNHTETIISLANLHNRHFGIEAALAVLVRHIESPETTSSVRGAVVAEAARITYEYSGDANAARQVWQNRREQCLDSESFWLSWFTFEFHQPTSKDKQPARHMLIKGVFDDVKQGSHLAPEAMMNLTTAYQKYLQQHGGKDAMKEYIQLDQEMHGPAGLQGSVKAKLAGTGSSKPLSVHTGAENGQASSFG